MKAGDLLYMDNNNIIIFNDNRYMLFDGAYEDLSYPYNGKIILIFGYMWDADFLEWKRTEVFYRLDSEESVGVFYTEFMSI